MPDGMATHPAQVYVGQYCQEAHLAVNPGVVLLSKGTKTEDCHAGCELILPGISLAPGIANLYVVNLAAGQKIPAVLRPWVRGLKQACNRPASTKWVAGNIPVGGPGTGHAQTARIGSWRD